MAVNEYCENLIALTETGDLEKLKAKVGDLNKYWERLEISLKSRYEAMKVDSIII